MKTTKALLLAGILVPAGLAVSCADDIPGGGGSGGGKGAAVTFSVSDAQDDAQKAAAGTRALDGTITRAAFADGLAMQGLAPEDLVSQKIDAQGGGGLCLIETTVAGSNPVRRDGARTRAEVTTMATMGGFSAAGYRGASAGDIAATPWFHNRKAGRDGALAEPVYWSAAEPWGRFYAVSPQVETAYTKLTVSPDTHGGTPYVDFEAETDAENQKDLMTACSGTVHYGGGAEAPAVPLRFRHALTAVRFKVGGNLSWNQTITKVEIIGARSKGRYTLPSDEKGTDAGWSGLSAPATFTLGRGGGRGTLAVSTSQAVNTIIVGREGDNGTFYMIPQSLDGVTVRVWMANGRHCNFPLKGTWKPGTTKTYAISERHSGWEYVLNVTAPGVTAYNRNTPETGYTVQSYRTDRNTGTQQPVAWKITGYDLDGDGKFSMDEKPDWLTSLTLTEGGGGTQAEEGMPELRIDTLDLLPARNEALRSATPRGSAASPYDLSTKGGSVPRSTANCYVISAPGHYRIPLVYGNAITDGKENSRSYLDYNPYNRSSAFLHNFLDHAEEKITNPWITLTNNGVNIPDGVKLVWADEKGLVTGLTLYGSGTDAFLDFEVPASAIRNGNAVIAVTKGGTVVWSWHLWFAPEEVLGTVSCTNFENKIFNFTNETLGWKYTIWSASTYPSPRSVRVRVNTGKEDGVFTVTQANGGTRKGYGTLYQWGRKDAIPATDAIAEGSFFPTLEKNMFMSFKASIQNPDKLLPHELTHNDRYRCVNLWGITDPTSIDERDDETLPMTKTVYDPCPPGFMMPASDAFTGFSKNGGKRGPYLFKENAPIAWDQGWHFYNRITNPDTTIYFPSFPIIIFDYCKSMEYYRKDAQEIFYWSGYAAETDWSARAMDIFAKGMLPNTDCRRDLPQAVRPVSE